MSVGQVLLGMRAPHLRRQRNMLGSGTQSTFCQSKWSCPIALTTVVYSDWLMLLFSFSSQINKKMQTVIIMIIALVWKIFCSLMVSRSLILSHSVHWSTVHNHCKIFSSPPLFTPEKTRCPFTSLQLLTISYRHPPLGPGRYSPVFSCWPRFQRPKRWCHVFCLGAPWQSSVHGKSVCNLW